MVARKVFDKTKKMKHVNIENDKIMAKTNLQVKMSIIFVHVESYDVSKLNLKYERTRHDDIWAHLNSHAIDLVHFDLFAWVFVFLVSNWSVLYSQMKTTKIHRMHINNEYQETVV